MLSKGNRLFDCSSDEGKSSLPELIRSFMQRHLHKAVLPDALSPVIIQCSPRLIRQVIPLSIVAGTCDANTPFNRIKVGVELITKNLNSKKEKVRFSTEPFAFGLEKYQIVISYANARRVIVCSRLKAIADSRPSFCLS